MKIIGADERLAHRLDQRARLGEEGCAPAINLEPCGRARFRLVVPPLARVSGFAGASVHMAPGSELASQVALIFPPYDKVEVSCRLAFACAPGVPDSVCVPEMK